MADMNMRGVVDLGALAAARKQEAASAVAKASAPAGVIVDATDATFERDVLQQSAQVPVILDFWATWCAPCRQLSPILEKLAAEYGGRIILAKVDSDANPGLSQAFRVQSIPSVFALIGGQPVPLFQGAYPEAQVRQFIDKVLEVAKQAGVTGTVGGAAPEATAPAEPEADPRYVAVHEAIAAGQFDVAMQAAKALVDARDPEGAALVGFVALSQRMAGTTEALARAAAAAAPNSVPAVLAAADFEFMATGPGVYDRLIALLRTASGDDRALIKERLLDYFAIEGQTPESVAARKAMTAALF